MCGNIRENFLEEVGLELGKMGWEEGKSRRDDPEERRSGCFCSLGQQRAGGEE